ncbi:Fic family protein [Slackia isoflavoniconvertens]|uniref:Fic family protein n=1 Tax=Slackia isoflavoniconvertens TaxID=572010 RepID=UPI003AF0AE04
MQESIIDAESSIPISNACICGRQVHRRVQARDRRMLISTGRPVTECRRELELAENYLRDLERGDFIKRMAFYIAEINALHPFREGSGRFLSKTAVARQ